MDTEYCQWMGDRAVSTVTYGLSIYGYEFTGCQSGWEYQRSRSSDRRPESADAHTLNRWFNIECFCAESGYQRSVQIDGNSRA